jgi:hypothetical protein
MIAERSSPQPVISIYVNDPPVELIQDGMLLSAARGRTLAFLDEAAYRLPKNAQRLRFAWSGSRMVLLLQIFD